MCTVLYNCTLTLRCFENKVFSPLYIMLNDPWWKYIYIISKEIKIIWLMLNFKALTLGSSSLHSTTSPRPTIISKSSSLPYTNLLQAKMMSVVARWWYWWVGVLYYYSVFLLEIEFTLRCSLRNGHELCRAKKTEEKHVSFIFH